MVKSGEILFGSFQVIAQLSLREADAVFFCCEVLNPNRYVVLKLFERGSLSQQIREESVQIEISASYKINHQNVLKSYDFLQDDQYFGFTMEFVDGCTLAQRLQEQGQFSIQLIVDILCQMASGLQAIHQGGILHRDLKPDNVMISKDNQVKIGDFGVAIRCAERGAAKGTEIVGTIDYLSPEYLRTGEYTISSDVYAFGILAYELVVGAPPFAELDEVEALVARATRDPLSPRELRPDCPMQLNDVIMRAIDRSPEKRFSSADELRQSLEPLKEWLAMQEAVRVMRSCANPLPV
ncbi:MAG: serine/threonine protein kinase [Oligoflexia bacterium]|nr:serine/threonine protein kinase [Oligoflexia bacterium]